MGVRQRLRQCRESLERWLEAEREQLVLWLPVMLGAGVTAWFVLPDAGRWIGFIAGAGAVALAGVAIGRNGRAARVLAGAVAEYLEGDAPFVAKLHPEYSPYGDYDQLMRLDEWYGRQAREPGE